MLTWPSGVDRMILADAVALSVHGFVFVMLKKVSQSGNSHTTNSDCTAGESEEAQCRVGRPLGFCSASTKKLRVHDQQCRSKELCMYPITRLTYTQSLSITVRHSNVSGNAVTEQQKHTKPSIVTATSQTCQDVPLLWQSSSSLCGNIRLLLRPSVMEIPCDSSRLWVCHWPSSRSDRRLGTETTSSTYRLMGLCVLSHGDG